MYEYIGILLGARPVLHIIRVNVNISKGEAEMNEYRV
jgi:hypothetical protein